MTNREKRLAGIPRGKAVKVIPELKPEPEPEPEPAPAPPTRRMIREECLARRRAQLLLGSMLALTLGGNDR